MRYDPRQMIVLGAISRGAKKFDKIRGATGIDGEELNQILEELEKDGLIGVEEKKGLFGKKVEITATDKGRRELDEGLGEMQQKWGQMQQMYETKDKKGLKGFMDDNRSFLPMMMFFGIMDMMMFSMMFSMIGSSMGSYVPADQVPPGSDAGAGDAGGAGQDYSDPMGDGGGGFDFDFGF